MRRILLRPGLRTRRMKLRGSEISMRKTWSWSMKIWRNSELSWSVVARRRRSQLPTHNFNRRIFRIMMITKFFNLRTNQWNKGCVTLKKIWRNINRHRKKATTQKWYSFRWTWKKKKNRTFNFRIKSTNFIWLWRQKSIIMMIHSNLTTSMNHKCQLCNSKNPQTASISQIFTTTHPRTRVRVK